MTEAEHVANDEAVARLKALRAEILAKVWPAAVEAAQEYDPALVRELVRLHADIEAIDFALKQRPTRPARMVKIKGF